MSIKPSTISHTASKQDNELVEAVLGGDKQAFNQLVHRYQSGIYNLTLNYLKQSEEALDLTQDIFVTAYRSLGSLKDVKKFKPWLYQIAVNQCRNRYRKLKRRGFFSSQSIDDPDCYLQLTAEDNPEENVLKKNLIGIMQSTISAMPHHEKEILLLRDIQGLSYEEVSKTLDLPIGTVKSKLNRARTSLKNRLKKYI